MSVHERTRRDIELQLNIMRLMETHNGIMSEFTALLRGMQVNGILWSGSVTISASGVATLDTRVPYAFVHVVNLGADIMTLANRPASDAAPGPGLGVKKIPAGAALGFNLVGSSLSIYGAANDVADIEVHVKPDHPH